MSAYTRFATFDPTPLEPVGYGYRFVASGRSVEVAPTLEVIGIDSDRDGRLDQRLVLKLDHYDANGDGLITPGEVCEVRHAKNESLHRDASPFIPQDLFKAACRRVAERINGG